MKTAKVEQKPKFRVLEEEPKMRQLRTLQSGAVTVCIIEEVLAYWVDLADFLDLPTVTVRNLRAEPNFTPESACRTVFERWLNGQGRGPRTWDTLVQVLGEMGMRSLAENIVLALKG